MIDFRAIGSFTVTAPAIYYLIANAPEPIGDHDHEHIGGEHKDGEHEEEGGSEESADASADGSGETTGEESAENADEAGGSSEGSEAKSEDEGSKSQNDNASEGASEDSGESSEQDTPDASVDEESKDTAKVVDSGSEVEGVQFKGATRHGEVGDTRKHIPDSKGGAKKRIESDYGKRQGEKEDEEPNPDGTPAVDPVGFLRFVFL